MSFAIWFSTFILSNIVAPSLAKKNQLDVHADQNKEPTDCDVSIWTLEHLVHPFGSKRGAHNAGNRLGSEDVCLLCLQPFDAMLCLLFLKEPAVKEDEGFILTPSI